MRFPHPMLTPLWNCHCSSLGHAATSRGLLQLTFWCSGSYNLLAPSSTVFPEPQMQMCQLWLSFTTTWWFLHCVHVSFPGMTSILSYSHNLILPTSSRLWSHFWYCSTEHREDTELREDTVGRNGYSFNYHLHDKSALNYNITLFYIWNQFHTLLTEFENVEMLKWPQGLTEGGFPAAAK